jgi:hypothetical protein
VKVGGQHFPTSWLHPANERVVQLIDQRFLSHRFVIEEVNTVAQMATAIREMHVRGAGLIGASAGYGMYLATIEAAGSPAVAGFDRQLLHHPNRSLMRLFTNRIFVMAAHDAGLVTFGKNLQDAFGILRRKIAGWVA